MKKTLLMGCLVAACCLIRVMSVFSAAEECTSRVRPETRTVAAVEEAAPSDEEITEYTQEEQEACTGEQDRMERTAAGLGMFIMGDFSGYTQEDIRHAATINVYDLVKNIIQVKNALPAK